MTFEEYATQWVQPYKNKPWRYCTRHRGLVLPKGYVVEGKDQASDGMCKRCCWEWIEKFGDTPTKWALAQLRELETAVNRGDYS